MDHIEIRVVNRDGKDVMDNGIEQGEIIVKSLGLTSDDTQKGGWFHTGDQGTIDKNGHIQIVKPHQDIVDNNGDSVSSVEIENICHDHPAIEEIAVIPIPDEKKGEILHAFVVLKDNLQTTEKELIHFVKKHFSSSHSPVSFTFIDELPKTRSGKILKMQLINHT